MIRPLGIGYSVLWKPQIGAVPLLDLDPNVPLSLPSNARAWIRTDSVSGAPYVELDVGRTFSVTGLGVDALSKTGATLILVARQRVLYAGATQTIADSSGNGATPGFQLQAIDNNGAGAYRILRPRISNGSLWVVDHASPAPANTYEALKTFVLATTTDGTHSRVTVDHALAYDDPYSITLPPGAPGPLVIGGAGIQFDVFRLQVWQ